MEGTLCDLLFLTFLFEKRIKHGRRRMHTDGDNFLTEGTSSAEKAAGWVIEDFSFARLMGFGATER